MRILPRQQWKQILLFEMRDTHIPFLSPLRDDVIDIFNVCVNHQSRQKMAFNLLYIIIVLDVAPFGNSP